MFKQFLIISLLLLCIYRGYSQLDQELEETFQNILDQDRDKWGYNGISAALIYPDGCTWSGISGSSTGEDTITTETMFQSGLCTQFFTATIIMMLQEEGKLSVHDAIGAHLPPINNVDSSITIKQLLNHTSGLELLLDVPEFEILLYHDPAKIWNPDSLLSQFLKPAPLQPGESFSWSSANYIILGKLIEKIANRPYHIEVRQRIIEPLGLKNTFLPPHEELVGNLAVGKDIFTGQLFTSNMNAIFSSGWSGNALVSTPIDILRFLKALFDGDLVSENSLQMMRDTINITGQFGEWQGLGLGIGFLEYKGIPFNGQTSFLLHRTRAYYSPESKLGVTTFITELNGTDAFYQLVDVIAESLNFCTVTSTFDQPFQPDIDVSPNPSNDVVRIGIDNDHFSTYNLTIYNHLGQLVKNVVDVSGFYELTKQEIGSGQFFIRITLDHMKYAPAIKKVNIY